MAQHNPAPQALYSSSVTEQRVPCATDGLLASIILCGPDKVIGMLRLLLVLPVLLASCASDSELTAPSSFGAPIRIGNRAYLLTWQRSSTLRTSKLFVDFWAFDTVQMKALYRSRLQTVPGGALEERFILGVQDKTIWLLMPDGPYAVALDTGALAMNPDDLTRLNPQLRGLLPTSKAAYRFTETGLAVKTVDAQAWHLHPETYLVSLKVPTGTGRGMLPAEYSLQSTSRLLERGGTVGDQWIGLLSAKESVDFPKQHVIGGLDFQSKRALYSAQVKPVEADFGPKLRYSEFKALTPEFLAPSVLNQNQDPKSVFILHKDMLEEKGRFFLSRFSKAAGKVVWTTDLSISEIHSVLPGEASLLVYGRRRQSSKEEQERFLSIDWTTGKILTFDQGEHSKYPVIP